MVSIPSHEFFRDDTWFDNPRKSSDNIHIETFWIFYGNNVFTSQSLSSIWHVPVTQWFFKTHYSWFFNNDWWKAIMCKKHWLYIFFTKPYIIYSCVLNIVIVFFHVTNSLKKLLRQLHRISFMNNNRGSGIPEDPMENPPPSLLLII